MWPYLLGHYKFGSTKEQRDADDLEIRTAYEHTMTEWLAVEAIVRQRDKEIMAANLAKLSSESTDGQIPLVRKDSSLSNDVFEDSSIGSVDMTVPEPLEEESETAATTPSTEHPPSAATAEGEDKTIELEDDVNDDDEIPVSVPETTTEAPPGETPTKRKLESLDEGLGDSIQGQSSISETSKHTSHDSADTDSALYVPVLKSESDDADGGDGGNIVITNPSLDSGSEGGEVAQAHGLRIDTNYDELCVELGGGQGRGIVDVVQSLLTIVVVTSQCLR